MSTVRTQSEQSFIQERAQALRDDFDAKLQRLARQRRKVRHEASLRSQLALGRLKDGGQQCVINASAIVVGRISGGLEWANSRAGLDILDASIKRLDGLAEDLDGAAVEVDRPEVEGYDGLNVGAVKEALEGLSLYGIHKVGQYEAENKNRVTVLRKVEAKLSPNF